MRWGGGVSSRLPTHQRCPEDRGRDEIGATRKLVLVAMDVDARCREFSCLFLAQFVGFALVSKI